MLNDYEIMDELSLAYVRPLILCPASPADVQLTVSSISPDGQT